MKYTNKFELPDVYARAAINDPYDKGLSDFSATGLATPPRAAALLLSHADSVEIDVSARVAAIIGQGAHSIAERAARPGIDICEKRFFATFNVDGRVWTVSAQVDLYEPDTGNLYDWKTTKAYAFSKKAGSGRKPEWIEQMNIGAEIMRRQTTPLQPRSLQIIAMLKDWNKRDAATGSHPPSEVVAVELPLWEREKVVAHIEERIRLHVQARQKLPACTMKETWGGNRCGQWCDAASVCEQYKQSLKTGLMAGGAE